MYVLLILSVSMTIFSFVIYEKNKDMYNDTPYLIAYILGLSLRIVVVSTIVFKTGNYLIKLYKFIDTGHIESNNRKYYDFNVSYISSVEYKESNYEFNLRWIQYAVLLMLLGIMMDAINIGLYYHEDRTIYKPHGVITVIVSTIYIPMTILYILYNGLIEIFMCN